MRYAGPRSDFPRDVPQELCAKFIVTATTLAKYYGTYDAQKIFAQFKPGAGMTLNLRTSSARNGAVARAKLARMMARIKSRCPASS
jgi:ATP sulfurylase